MPTADDRRRALDALLDQLQTKVLEPVKAAWTSDLKLAAKSVTDVWPDKIAQASTLLLQRFAVYRGKVEVDEVPPDRDVALEAVTNAGLALGRALGSSSEALTGAKSYKSDKEKLTIDGARGTVDDAAVALTSWLGALVTFDGKIEPDNRAEPSGSFTMNGKVIDHVVCLMLENRGFDHVLGYLYEGDLQPAWSIPKPSLAKGAHAGLRRFEGLDGLDPLPTSAYDYDYTTVERQYLVSSKTVERNIQGVATIRKGAHAANIPATNPHEDFIHIFQDMYGARVPDPHAMEDATTRNQAVQLNGTYRVPTMDGWAQNFCDGIRHHRGEKDTVLTNAMVDEILEIYVPDQLPVLSGLARNYAVSDLWFCSVPSQTNTNRAFWASGHAAGIVKNDFRPAIKVGYASDQMPDGNDGNGIPFRRSLFDVLDEAKHSWKYYWSVPYPPVIPDSSTIEVEPVGDMVTVNYDNYYYFKSMFPQFKNRANVTSIDDFYEDARNGTLPRVSYIEPWWGGGKQWDALNPATRAVGNDFHPVQDMVCGEFFIKDVYDAIMSGPKADSTLLVITFDENGGTYDHFPPWPATPPGRATNLPNGVSQPLQPQEYGYTFDSFGVRVPTLFISKYVKPETLIRSHTEVPFDHTSVISTVLEWLRVPKKDWKLGDRVAQAPSFAGVLAGDGSEEDLRRTIATGVAHYDRRRIARLQNAATIKYGDTFILTYLGNPWADHVQPACYLVDPVSYLNWWYPVATTAKSQALRWKFVGGVGNVTAGSEVVIEATGTTSKGKSLAGYSIALPSTPGAQNLYLYSGKSPSRWIPWLVNDRNRSVELAYGDEVMLFSEQYLPKNLAQPFGGVELCDPYKRMMLDAPKGGVRYASWRAGEWDVWRLEKP